MQDCFKDLSEVQNEIITRIKANKEKYYFKNKKKNKELTSLIDSVIQSCVHFVSDYFGSAVCISEKGHILTCSHCVSDDTDTKKSEFLLIYPDGQTVVTKVIFNDEELDLAILEPKLKPGRKTSYARISEIEPIRGDKLFCIGQPSTFELEFSANGKARTKYPPFYVSEGQTVGYMKDKVKGANGLGPFIHSCWTYWGHSGAPLFNLRGELVGLHNSWNDKNGKRHGCSLAAIKEILKIVNLN